ncbi:hypothetical protein CPC08DRAFT_717818 [Agrocybe pediades]|nr:hypothetical protein CPC08DRAFT_717818 [Agrocybe pediades]
MSRLLHAADESALSIFNLSRWVFKAQFFLRMSSETRSKQAKRKSTLWRGAKARAALKDEAHGEVGEVGAMCVAGENVQDGMVLEGCERPITKHPNVRKDRGIGSRSFAGVLAKTESSCAGGANTDRIAATILLSYSFRTSSPSHYFPCEQAVSQYINNF